MRRFLLGAFLLGLVAVAGAQERPLKSRAVLTVTGNTWTYKVNNGESSTSPLGVGAFQVPLEAPILSVFVPPGWGYNTDYQTYIVWFHLQGEPASKMISPGGNLTMGFTVEPGTESKTKSYVVQSWNKTLSVEGLSSSGEIKTPFLRPQVGSISFASSFVYGIQEVVGTVTLTRPAPPNGADVLFNAVGNLAKTSPGVYVRPGETTATFGIRGGEPTVTTTVAIEAGTPGGIKKSKGISVRPNPVTYIDLNRSQVRGGGTSAVTGTVKLKLAPAVDTKISLVSSDPAAAEVPATVTIRAGTTSATFAFVHHKVTANKTVTVSATKGGVTLTDSIDVLK